MTTGALFDSRKSPGPTGFSDPVQFVAPGTYSVYNAANYQAFGDGISDATAGLKNTSNAAILAGGGKGAEIFVGPGTYKITSNPFIDLITGGGNAPVLMRLSQAVIQSTKQIKIPRAACVRGSNRLRCGFVADLAFITNAVITSISLVGNVATVDCATPHGLEAGATVVVDGVVTATIFNGGWQVQTVPSTTRFTFQCIGGNQSDNTGTVFIPFTVEADWVGGSGTRLENLSIDCQNLVGSIGLYSNSLQELAGASDVLINNAYKRGIWLERHGQNSTGGAITPNNYRFENMEVSVTPNVGGVAVYLRSTFGMTRGFDNITTNTATNTGTSAAGFDVSGCPGVYSRIHCEHCTDGFLIGNRGFASSAAIGRDSAGIIIQNITGEASVTNLVHLKNFGEVNNVVIQGSVRLVAGHNIVDDVSGLTLDDDYVGIYVIGGIPTTTRFSSSPNVPWLIGQNMTVGGGTLGVGLNALAAVAQLQLNAVAGQNRQINFLTAGGLRWIFRVDGVAEGGADAGSGCSLLARHDDGSALDTVWAVARAALSSFQLFRPLSLSSELRVSQNSPAQITADQNDYALPAAVHIRLNTDAARAITGFTGINTGRTIYITNVGAFNITFKNQNAGSTAGNRIITGTGADRALAPDLTFTFVYDNATGRWRIMN